jgi:hypothetical protein
MPSTVTLLPSSTGMNAGSTTDIDGVTYTQLASAQTNRIDKSSTGTNSAAFTTDNQICWMKNFFNDNQIPAGATILGIEIVAIDTGGGESGGSYLGSAGSSSGGFKFRAYLHNGTSFSSPLEHKLSVDSITGITSTDSGASLTYSGGVRHYFNNTASDDNILYGAANDLSGLSWNASNQAEFGFAVTFTEETGTGVGIWLRGISMRATYSTGFGKKVCNLTATSVSNFGVPTSIINIPSS